MRINEMADYVTPPKISEIRCVAVTATSAATRLDNDAILQGKGRCYVSFTADGADVYLQFGPNSSITANSAATTGNNRTYVIYNGTEKHFVLNSADAQQAYVAAATANGGSQTATLRFYRSSGPEHGVTSLP